MTLAKPPLLAAGPTGAFPPDPDHLKVRYPRGVRFLAGWRRPLATQCGRQPGSVCLGPDRAESGRHSHSSNATFGEQRELTRTTPASAPQSSPVPANFPTLALLNIDVIFARAIHG